MNSHTTLRDERTITVENASYRWGYLVLSFGLLLDVAYRGLVRQEASWDLLGLVLLGGLVTTWYQGSRSILGHRWWLTGLITALTAAAIAAVLALTR